MLCSALCRLIGMRNRNRNDTRWTNVINMASSHQCSLHSLHFTHLNWTIELDTIHFAIFSSLQTYSQCLALCELRFCWLRRMMLTKFTSGYLDEWNCGNCWRARGVRESVTWTPNVDTIKLSVSLHRFSNWNHLLPHWFSFNTMSQATAIDRFGTFFFLSLLYK